MKYAILAAFVAACSGTQPPPKPVEEPCDHLLAMGCFDEFEDPEGTCKDVLGGSIDYDLECVKQSQTCEESYEC